MNYGKVNTIKNQKNFLSRTVMKQKRVGVRCFSASLFIVILLIITAVACGFMFIKSIVDSAPTITPDDVSPVAYSSFIVDEDGTEIETLLQAGSNRIYTPIENIPEDLQNAFIAIEDSRFYDHMGIDPIGIARAGLVGIMSGGSFTEGASTITQQLIKNSVFVDFMEEETLYDRVERKIQEIYLALNLETQISKTTILENYLNTINLGQNTLGVQTAAERYFDKDVSELTLSECAVIAGITKNPTGYNPITYPEANAERREKVLSDMLTQGYITQAEYDEAMADTEDVYERIQAVDAQITEESSPYSYFTDATIEAVLEDLQEVLGYTYEQAVTKLYSGGITIYSTQDLELQTIVDEELNDDSNFPSNTAWNLTYALTIVREDGTEENYWTTHFSTWSTEYYGYSDPLLYTNYDLIEPDIELFKESLNITSEDTVYENLNIVAQPQAAFVLMDQTTGEVKAMTGGRGEKTTSLSFNRADEPRQPGSTFKIVAAYAPALDTGTATLASVIKDEAVQYTSGETVTNYSNSYQGNVTVRYAIYKSLNTIAVKLFYEVGSDVVWEYLMDFGFTTLVDYEDSIYYNDREAASALGGLTYGATPLEMTAAYAAIANGGTYTEPILYTQILDVDGSVLIDNTPETHTVIKESTASLLTSAMQSVVTVGTGGYASIGSQPVAGKTGTTSDSKDVWFVGYTPYYTAALWFGIDQPYDLSKLGWYSSYHTKLWSAIMTRVHEDLPVEQFEMSDSVSKVTVCSISGLLAATNKTVELEDMKDVEELTKDLKEGIYPDVITGTVTCPTTTEYFADGTAPTTICSCTDSGHTINISDPEPLPVEEEEEEEDTTSNNNSNNNSSSSNDSSSNSSSSNSSSDSSSSGNESSSSTNDNATNSDSNTEANTESSTLDDILDSIMN